MNPAGFLFRTFLLAVFTLSLVAGAIVTDYYLRHEITRKAKRFLAANGVELTPSSAIQAAEAGELSLLEKLSHAGVSMGVSDHSGRTPLLAAIQSRNLQVVDYLIKRDPVQESINLVSVEEKLTPLAAALGGRNFALADRLLKAGADQNVENAAGIPFLLKAVEERDKEMLDYLLSKSADVNYQGAHAVRAIAIASSNNDLDTMRRLFDAGADPNERGIMGSPLLVEAVKEQSAEKFSLLIERGASVNAEVELGSETPVSALSYAIELGNVAMQEALLEKGASPEVFDEVGNPVLVRVVRDLDQETTDRLLSAGASPDIADREGDYPLGIALDAEDLDFVDLLLEHSADPSFAPEGELTPLERAISQGQIAAANQLILAGADLDEENMLAMAYEGRDDPMMSLLLASGVSPESKLPGTGERVFDAAIHDGATSAVRTLLAAGASIGDNLWAALLTGQDDLIRLILDAGADPRQLGPEGQDPLDFCLKQQRYKAARNLLDGGANPNARFDDSESWLTKSIREGNSDIALALIEAGAEVKGIRAKDGHTLLGWSIAHEMADVVEALLNSGADPDSEERAPARSEFAEHFESTTFRYHLKVDRRIRPIMMAAAQRNHELAQMLMDAGANGRAYTPRYLMAAIIGSWYKDSDMQQIALLGKVPNPQPRKVVVDLSSQRVTLYENGVATYSTRCSTGKAGHRTPTGEYVISDRHRHHRSSIYGSSMPFFQRFSFSAFGLHQGHLPGYPASAGCIRLPYDGARHLFGKLKVGDYAVIQH